MDAESIPGLIVLTEDLQSFGVVHWLTSSEEWYARATGVAVQDWHLVAYREQTKKREKGDTDSDADFTKQSYELCEIKSFSEKKEREMRTRPRVPEIFDRQALGTCQG